jgi:8-oxo-dGTP diphosphatase
VSHHRYACRVDLHLLLRDEEGRILLGQRQNTGFMDGAWHFPSGHLEEGEAASAGLVREALEETGIVPETPKVIHVMQHHTDSGRVALFFEATSWSGEITNKEPDKCAGWQWFLPDALPQMIPYALQALEHIQKGEFYSERGWEQQ